MNTMTKQTTESVSEKSIIENKLPHHNQKLIRKSFFCSAYDFESLETYLSQMASNGLMFVKQKGFFYYEL